MTEYDKKKNNVNIPKVNTEKLWKTTGNPVVREREGRKTVME